ncbi:MAG TPA: hypothetical protein VGH14_05005 [Solirubrobacterales bacterium]|jgi:membrane protein YqaA with SNARE-associated domain
MSVRTKLARQAVKKTAKHTAHGATARLSRKPLRSVTLLGLGAALGGIVGWRIGRSGGNDAYAPAPGPQGAVTDIPNQTSNNSTEHASETGAVS